MLIPDPYRGLFLCRLARSAQLPRNLCALTAKMLHNELRTVALPSVLTKGGYVCNHQFWRHQTRALVIRPMRTNNQEARRHFATLGAATFRKVEFPHR